MADQLPPPQKYESPDFQHLEAFAPLGQTAVSEEEKRVQTMYERDFAERAGAYVMQFSELPDPRYKRWRQQVKRLIGGPKPDNELAAWLNDTHQMNLSVIPNQIKHTVDMYKQNGKYRVFNVESDLRRTRRALQYLSVDEREKLDEYFNDKAPEYFQNNFAEWKCGTPGDVADWLSEVPKDNQGPTSGPLLNFLQWHNYHIEQLNADPETVERIKAEKQQYIEHIESAVRAGLLPESALESAQSIEAVPMYIGDAFDLSIKSLSGLHDSRKGHVLLKEGYTLHTFMHEANHAVFGGFKNAVWNETITDHLVDVLESKDYENSQEIKDDLHETSYPFRRRIIKTIVNGSTIDMKTVFAAYCETDLDGSAHNTLDQQLKANFSGRDINKFVEVQYMLKLQRMDENTPNSRMQLELIAFADMPSRIQTFRLLLAGKNPEEIITVERKKFADKIATIGSNEETSRSLLTIFEAAKRAEIKEVQPYV